MEISKVMFCKVCGFRVRVWASYITSRSFGYGYGSVTELTDVPVIVVRACRTHRSSGYGNKSVTELPELPGIVARAYRTYRSSGQI